MECPERLGKIGSGLLIVGEELLTQTAQQYRADYSNHRTMLDRYIEAIKEMQKVRAVSKWMSENRQKLAWIDQALETQQNREGRGYRQREFSSGRDRDVIQYDHNNSDPEQNEIMNYSEESDGDYGGHEYKPGSVLVRGAGMAEVNGVYTSTRKFDGVPKFSKLGMYNSEQREFSLFRCVLSDQTRRWYISVIPPNMKPGTNKDIDFYFCPATGMENETPHEGNWEPSSKDSGLSPAPTVEWINDDLDDSQRVSSNDEYDQVVDDDEMDGPLSC